MFIRLTLLSLIVLGSPVFAVDLERGSEAGSAQMSSVERKPGAETGLPITDWPASFTASAKDHSSSRLGLWDRLRDGFKLTPSEGAPKASVSEDTHSVQDTAGKNGLQSVTVNSDADEKSDVPAAPSMKERFGPYADLWDRIRDGFMLPSLDSARVARQVNWFETHPDYMYRLVDRSRRYLYYIVDEVQKRGMPSEIALLPIIESAFDPRAKSPANAMGMWQFIPSTGKLYGMRQDWWYDGRRDVVAATNGALDYLEKLHTQFGAWDLALAAYNCGEGAVQRAIERNQKLGKPTDFASLNLPEETKNYVPKLLAAREIVGDPLAHGLNLMPIADQPYFAAISTTRHMDVAAAARIAGLSESEFLALNPGYNRPVILAKGEQTILVPVANAETFKSRLEDPNAKLVSWRTVQLRRGESYSSVASQFGMSGDELKRVNGIAPKRSVAGGGVVLVRDPGNHEYGIDLDVARPEAETALPGTVKTFKHRLKKGETLATVAQQFNVSQSELRTWNKLSELQAPHVGQVLVMHRQEEGVEPSNTGTAPKPKSKQAQTSAHTNKVADHQKAPTKPPVGSSKGKPKKPNPVPQKP